MPSGIDSGGSHPLGWKIALVLLLGGFALGDASAVAWAAGIANGGLIAAAWAGFVLVAALLLITVWIMERSG